jgi:hypothetical protein
MKMPIDHIIEWLATTLNQWWTIAVDAPTHFTREHWIAFSAIACLFGFFCMRGFGSRKNY